MDGKNREDILQKDALDYPACYHSHSSSKSCSNNAEGKFVCESLDRVMRVCPNKKPVLVFERKENGLNGQELFPFADIFGSFGFGAANNKKDRVPKDSFSGNLIENFMNEQRKQMDSMRREAMQKDEQSFERSRTQHESNCAFPDEFDNQLNDAMNEKTEIHGRTEGPIRGI